MVVDDHLISRRYITEALRRCGWAVKHCRSAEEALPLFKTWNPHLLVTDLNLPDADGLQLAEKLGRLPGNPLNKTTMLLITANTSAGLEQKARQAGFCDTWLKPFDIRRLQRFLTCPGHPQVRNSTATGFERDIQAYFRVELEDALSRMEDLLLNRKLTQAGALSHQLIASAAICGHPSLEYCLHELDQACRNSADISSLACCFTGFHRQARTVLSP